MKAQKNGMRFFARQHFLFIYLIKKCQCAPHSGILATLSLPYTDVCNYLESLKHQQFNFTPKTDASLNYINYMHAHARTRTPTHTHTHTPIILLVSLILLDCCNID